MSRLIYSWSIVKLTQHINNLIFKTLMVSIPGLEFHYILVIRHKTSRKYQVLRAPRRGILPTLEFQLDDRGLFLLSFLAVSILSAVSGIPNWCDDPCSYH